MAPPVGGYYAWYDASQIAGVSDGAALATWPDLSGNGYDMTQATGGSRPTFYKTTSAQLLNGLPTVRFAASKWVASSAAGLMRSYPYTVACVYVVDSFPGAISFLLSSNATGVGLYLFTSGTQVGMHSNGDQFIHATDISPHVISAVYNGASSIAQYDATPVTISSSNVMDGALTSYVSLGGDNGTNNINGRIGELVIYPSALSAAQLVTLNTYLTNKWVPGPALNGTATLALGPFTLTAAGVVSGGTVTGTAALPLGPVTLAATGILRLGATITIGPLTLTSAGATVISAPPYVRIFATDRPAVSIGTADRPATTIATGDR